MNLDTRGNRTPLSPAQQELALRFLPLARGLARPFKTAWPSLRDDFESAACLALVESAEAFEPERNIKFITFARHRIWGSLRDVQRSVLPLGWRGNPEEAPVVGSLPRECERRGRVLADPDEAVGKDLEDHDALEGILRKLPRRHADACRRLYAYRESQHEAATALGYSQSRLSTIHREALAILRGEAS